MFCFLGPYLAISSNQGLDLYGQKRSLTKSLQLLFLSFQITEIRLALIVSVISTVILIFIKKKKSSDSKSTITLVILLITILMMTDYVVYGDNLINKVNRYSVLIQVGLAIITILVLFQIYVGETFNRNFRRAILFIVTLILFSGFIPNFLSTIQHQESVVKSSTALSHFMTKMQEISFLSGNVPIVIQASTAFDSEPVYSLTTYLDANNILNARYLVLGDFKGADPFQESLVTELRRFSNEGESNLGIAPLSALDITSDSYCIVFGQAKSNLRNCIETFNIPVIGPSG
jgi:hypothetical protein